MQPQSFALRKAKSAANVLTAAPAPAPRALPAGEASAVKTPRALPAGEASTVKTPLALSLRKAKSVSDILLAAQAPPEAASLTHAKSVYTSAHASRTHAPAPRSAAPTPRKEPPPLFLLQSVADELTAARVSNVSKRILGVASVSARSASFAVVDAPPEAAPPLQGLSPRALEAAVGSAKDHLRQAKKKLTAFSSIEHCVDVHAARGQRGIEDACQALLAVDEYYQAERAVEAAARAWYNDAAQRVA